MTKTAEFLIREYYWVLNTMMERSDPCMRTLNAWMIWLETMNMQVNRMDVHFLFSMFGCIIASNCEIAHKKKYVG